MSRLREYLRRHEAVCDQRTRARRTATGGEPRSRSRSWNRSQSRGRGRRKAVTKAWRALLHEHADEQRRDRLPRGVHLDAGVAVVQVVRLRDQDPILGDGEAVLDRGVELERARRFPDCGGRTRVRCGGFERDGRAWARWQDEACGRRWAQCCCSRVLESMPWSSGRPCSQAPVPGPGVAAWCRGSSAARATQGSQARMAGRAEVRAITWRPASPRDALSATRFRRRRHGLRCCCLQRPEFMLAPLRRNPRLEDRADTPTV